MEGVRFGKREYTFNSSKVDRMFSYSKIDYRLNLNVGQAMRQDQAQSQSATVQTGMEFIASALGSLLSPIANGNSEDQEYLYRQPKKKKKRRYGRQM